MTSKARASVISPGPFSVLETHPRTPTGCSPSPEHTEEFWLHRFLLPKAILLDLHELVLGKGNLLGKSDVIMSGG